MAKETTEVTPPVEETPPPETETQPENLQARIDALTAENERLDGLHKDGQRKESRIAERERKQNILDTIPSLVQRLDGIEEYQAMNADSLEELRGIQGIEERPPTRRSHFEELRQKRELAGKAEKPKTETPVDPENLRATILVQGIIADMNWDMEHPAVKKILHLEDEPQEALKILRKEQKSQRDKEVEETVQAKIKLSGVTTPETAGPSGQGTRSYTPAQIRAMPYEEYASQKDDIEKAYRAGKIK